jgi:hypothetical protein
VAEMDGLSLHPFRPHGRGYRVRVQAGGSFGQLGRIVGLSRQRIARIASGAE